ncbi:MAG: DUF4238 domain-containing protein [Luteolibacter sp.]
MGQPEVKNQHYVPRVYLQRFANTKEQIWVYDKELRNSFQTNVKNVAAENRFYDSELLEVATGDKQFVERYLDHIEDKYAAVSESILGSLRSNKFKILSVRHRHFLAAYMVIQWMRTKEARIEHQQMTEVFQKIYQKMFSDRGLTPPPHHELLDERPTEEIARDLQNSGLLDAKRISMMANVLYGHIWVIFEAPGGASFFTSDHPFVKRPHIVDPLRGTDGIASNGIEIMFPLSPRYALTLYDRDYFSEVSSADGTLALMKDPEDARYYNQFQVFQSSRFVFARDNDFSDVEAIIERKPIYGEAGRKRIVTNQDDDIGRSGEYHNT